MSVWHHELSYKMVQSLNNQPDSSPPEVPGLHLLRSSLDRAVELLGSGTVIAKVIKLWPEVVDEDFVTHCQPERLTAGRLLVRVDDSNWATELRFHGAYIVQKLNELLGSEAVTRLDITTRK